MGEFGGYEPVRKLRFFDEYINVSVVHNLVKETAHLKALTKGHLDGSVGLASNS